MLINKSIIDNLYKDAGERRIQRAKEYKDFERVKILNVEYENEANLEIMGMVRGSENYRTYINIKNAEIEDITCNCSDYQNHYGVCKHTLATIMVFLEEERYKNQYDKEQTYLKVNTNQEENQYRSFKQMVNAFYMEELNEIDNQEAEIKDKGSIEIEPKILYDKFSGDMRVEFKIGNRKKYKIKNLAEFYKYMLNHEFFRYGEKLQFTHRKEMFKEESQELLDFILKYAEIIKYANSNSNINYRYYGNALSEANIILSNSGIDELFDILKGKDVVFQRDYSTEVIKFTEEQPKIEFNLEKMNEEKFRIVPNTEIFAYTIIRGKDYKYVLDGSKLYRCTKKFEKSNLKLLELFRQDYTTEIVFGKKDMINLFSIVLPRVKEAIKMQDTLKQELEKFRPKDLTVKVFLDFDKNNFLIADVKFGYEKQEFNPLNEKEKITFPRNMVKETKALSVFRKTGFMLDTQNLRFILTDNDKIYEFLTQDINYYTQKFNVMVTENFKTKQIRQPKIGNMGVKVENDLLSIDLNNLDIDLKELKAVMEQYNLKKKYYRLKDGSFLELEDSQEIQFLDKLIGGLNVEDKEFEKGTLNLPVYRSLYLNKLLKGIKGTQITKNDNYKSIVNGLDKDRLEEEIQIPKSLENTLRYYQKTGFKWLKTLDFYKFGGILADDMGLGKTIQMLSIIVDYVENEKQNRRASLVVAPSSLSLYWKNEAEKFANGLKALVIRGSLSERKRQIEEIDNYDLVITSYDLLKRDIDLYKDKNYSFRFIIADEAQYLKNSNTQNAKSIKQIKADTRYALTGTPIENSLAELWSIFDFIMPDYLFSYRKFKSLYETPIVKENNQEVMDKLKMMIEPFVLRRNKKEVLKELPEKTVTVLENEMEEEQQKIYLTYLAQGKKEIAEQIEVEGFERSHIKILSVLTRLRQICCHPSLFIDNYKESSSKLEQCVQILEDAIQSEHKVLLFSSYTSMFPLLEEELKKRNIKYFKLTGSTKVDERIDLVDEFNENKDIKVFLISLKAGGTGLNLTGADVVIHYDPWWNISTENQATDRAYRIGQKNNVQVYKLITKNSIEEKIYELQQKKATLIDNMLSTKTSFINSLSKEEMMKLFE